MERPGAGRIIESVVPLLKHTSGLSIPFTSTPAWKLLWLFLLEACVIFSHVISFIYSFV